MFLFNILRTLLNIRQPFQKVSQSFEILFWLASTCSFIYSITDQMVTHASIEVVVRKVLSDAQTGLCISSTRIHPMSPFAESHVRGADAGMRGCHTLDSFVPVTLSFLSGASEHFLSP